MKRLERTTANREEEVTQEFAFRAPTAMSVQLVGDFTHWQQSAINLRKDHGGVWRTSIRLKPGIHHYRFLVDGQWRDDPECAVRVPSGLGEENMVREVKTAPAGTRG